MANQQLWAPWRLGYIVGDKETPEPAQPLQLLSGADPKCFLCQGAVATDDRERLIVRRSRHVLVVLNRFPYNNGHMLVAPRVHVGRLDQIEDEAQVELVQAITRMVSLLQQRIKPDGFNIGLNLGRTAGAGLPDHVHWHIVPRWSGDTNFMPTIAGVNVIPQSLDELWGLLNSPAEQV